MSTIVAEGVCRRFGDVRAVDDVSFRLAAGEVAALLGPNGAGKTTMLEMLEGHLAPSAGSISVLGADPRRGDRRWRARMGVVLQSTSLDAQLTVRDAIGVFAALYPRPRSVREVLELVDLEAQAGTRIGRLSGGQQRRVDLALGIVGRPELLFLDEPTTGLDPAARRKTWEVVEQLASDGTSVLFSTHYMEEAQRLADRLLVMRDGRLLADVPPGELRERALLSRVRLPYPPYAELTLRAAELADTLEQLIAWARAHDADLNGLEVGPPSLEDMYLALTGHA